MENKVLQKNIEQISEYDKSLADKILITDIEKANISITQTQNGEYNLLYNNVLIHNDISAVNEAKAIIDKIDNNEAIRIIYGLGLGYLPDEMAKLNNSKIVIYEPNLDILKFVLSVAEIDAIYNKNVIICSDKDTLKNHIQKLSQSNNDIKMTISFLSSYKNLFYPDIVETLNCAQKAQGLNTAQLNTFLKNAPLSVKHQFCNLKRILKNPDINSLKDIYKGKTALIVSAGPSLKDNIELIKNNQDKFVIFAVNVSLKLLAKYDIKPDFIAVIEQFATTGQFEGTDLKNSYVISDSFTNDYVHNLETKKTFNYISKENFLNPWIRKCLNITSDIDTIGTVSYTALKSAYLMGFSKIILIGQDLAYKNGELYAKGSQFDELEYVFSETEKKYIIKAKNMDKFIESFALENQSYKEQTKRAQGTLNFLNKNLYTVLGQNGNYLPTQTGYALFVDIFKDFSKEVLNENPNLTLINSSTGGAQIDGFKNISLSEVVKELEPIEKLDLSEVKKSEYDKTFVKQEIEKLENKLRSALLKFEECQKLTQRTLKELKLKRAFSLNFEKYLKKLKEELIRLFNFEKDSELKIIYYNAMHDISKNLEKDFTKNVNLSMETFEKINKILNTQIKKTNEIYLPQLLGSKSIVS